MFCNIQMHLWSWNRNRVAILVLVDSVLQFILFNWSSINDYLVVAILVLVDSVLQLKKALKLSKKGLSRNPCFSGQCFAILRKALKVGQESSRNPCFSGQCFAMNTKILISISISVAILVLVDSVLQCRFWWRVNPIMQSVAILVLVDSVLQ